MQTTNTTSTPEPGAPGVPGEPGAFTDVPPGADALYHLATSREALSAAHEAALQASEHLDGARKARANELAGLIADTIAITERLSFVVFGDMRSDADLDSAVARHPAGGGTAR
jgi:hypothetical protein